MTFEEYMLGYLSNLRGEVFLYEFCNRKPQTVIAEWVPRWKAEATAKAVPHEN